GATVVIPALRERLSELTSLADSFVLQICQQLRRIPPAISVEARAILGKYSWPGNIRELKNVIERAVLLCSGDEIRAHHLPIEKMGEVLRRNRASSRVPTPPKTPVRTDTVPPRTERG